MSAWLLGINVLIHLLLAWLLPLSNDEAYYWDWGQWLQWSYFDHPAGVAWMTAISSQLAQGTLGARLLAPFFSTLTLAISGKILEEQLGRGRERTRKAQRWLLILSLTSPGLLAMGSVALPDVGLLLCLQLGLWVSLRLAKKDRLRLSDALLWGAVLGAGGLFKYHAFPMGFGLGLGLLSFRWQAHKREPLFYGLGVLAALAILAPLWIWNYQHDWASFRFQAAHGFAAGSWSWQWPFQAFVSFTLLLGPFLFVRGLRSFLELKEQHWHDPLTRLTLLPVFLLLALIISAALRKPVLPHWILPAFSLALPWLLVYPFAKLSSQKWRGQIFYGSCVALILIVCSQSWVLRSLILPRFHGDPGPLTEITVWDPLVPELEDQLSQWESAAAAGPLCESNIPLAAVRWYAAAQLHVRMPGRPPVFSLQRLPSGFYTLRDQERRKASCPVAVLLDGDQRRLQTDMQDIETLDERKIIVPGHERQSWYLVLGRWR